MVGFDDVLNQTMDRLTRQQSGPRQIIPISGMGGIGKTTLTRNLYEDPYIVQHFDVCAWVTISQEYEIKKILSNLLIEFKTLKKETIQMMNEGELGENIHKHLFGRTYLIVMDDMWSIDVWDKVQLFIPDNGNGSGIVITTRLSNLASLLGSCGLEMNFLDEEKSWDLFRIKVFGQHECPPGLEEIGREITKSCKGLPLSIVVIAGLLAKSNMEQGYWNHVANEVNSIVSQAEDGQCSNILSLSYKNLPLHLKPCLLYMGVFPEDCEIKVSQLIKLWVAEGFLKPNKTITLEEVAEEYLTDLIDRNLIMVHRLSSRGKIKRCKIHDLLGDLCLREAQREKFICVESGKGLHSLRASHNERRIVIDESKVEQKDSAYFNNQGALSTSLPRSVTFNTRINSSLRGYRLIRVLSGDEEYELNQIASNQVNLRYLNYYSSKRFHIFLPKSHSPSSIYLMWNLQTIIIEYRDYDATKTHNIWEMKQLRHLCVRDVYLPEPPSLIAGVDGKEGSILKHLQTLKGICNLTFSEGVIKRIPNIKKLKCFYDDYFGDFERGKDYCISNLQYLLKLESLHIYFEKKSSSSLSMVGSFPHSLQKLTIIQGCLRWENMTMIGCLPNLQVLKLRWNALIGEEWNPIEGQFISLKYLEISECNELKVWNAESIHFPVLEKLHLSFLENLEEIPQGIGEMPTLRSIELWMCSDSLVRSAMDILDEQESQGNDDFKLTVALKKDTTQLQKLETRDNFLVQYY